LSEYYKREENDDSDDLLKITIRPGQAPRVHITPTTLPTMPVNSNPRIESIEKQLD
jgi:hypothetical protein